MSYMSNAVRVDGVKKAEIFIFALSTCGWCRKTKKLFRELGVEYSYIDVDQLGGSDREEARTAMAACNPQQSYPTISIDGGRKCMIGFAEHEIKEEFGNES